MGSLLGCSLAAILLAGSGVGSQAVETTLQDDAVLLHRTDAQLKRATRTMAELGVDRVRLTAGWSVLAPSTAARSKPRDFDASDTRTYPQAGLRALDRAVREIVDHGMKVQIDLAFWAPRWATAKPSSNPLRHRHAPDPKEFGAFARAVARRYSGRFTDHRNHVYARLPAVRMYTTWNEPNYHSFLQPQWKKKRRGGYRPYSPHLYRPMHEAAYSAIKSVSAANDVLIGGLSSFGSHVPGRGVGVPPMEFLRTMACVDRRLAPLQVPECEGVGPLRADGFSIHPYSVDVAPGTRAPHPDDLYLADLDRLDLLLSQLHNQGRTNAKWPVFVTEYGYETSPPDPTSLFTPAQQAQYMGWSTYLAHSQPGTRMFAQFLLRDIEPQPGRGWRDFQTGLFFDDWKPKPSAQAFKIPFFASYTVAPDGTPAVMLYGGVRPGDGRRIVRVERRAPGTDEWVPVATTGDTCDESTNEFFTDSNGFFRRLAPWQGPGEYRLGWSHGGFTEYGAELPVDAVSLIDPV